ncbi:hypothetical protein JCM9279_007544 [Rhodotorula babjevae]
MASLFGRPSSTAGYHLPADLAHAPSASLQPDYDAFAAPDDDGDDSDDDTHPYPHSHHHSVPPAAHGSSHPLARPATTLSSAAPPPHVSPLIPGAYDFEPQQEPGRAPAVPIRSRPSSLYGAPASTLDHRTDDDDDDDSHRYGRPHGASSASSSAAGAGSATGWRGIVARLRGQGPPGSSTSAVGSGPHADARESHGLLFSHDESDETDSEHPQRSSPFGAPSGASSYPPPSLHHSHMPLPARPPQFASPSSSSSGAGAGAGGRVFGGGQGNDGVFANLAAKPDNPNGDDIVGEGPGKDEVLPPYEAAQLDPSPQYWETTVITPGLYGPDDILVDGLPVGNLFSFAWNLLVSMSFQFVGFILTYILHTTHAAKNGSRAGLGVTLIQLGFYLKQRTDHPEFVDGDPLSSGDETGLNGALGPADGADAEGWSWWGGGLSDTEPGAATATLAALGSLPTQVGSAFGSMLDASDPDAAAAAAASATPFPTLMGDGVGDADMMRMSMAANEWMAFAMVTVGSFLLIGSCLAYWRAVRYARAIREGQGPGADGENVVAF